MKQPFIQRANPILLESYLQKIGSDDLGIQIMKKKSRDFVFLISHIPLSALHILKQEALSVGSDVATPRDFILSKKSHYDAILFGSYSQISRIIQKCSLQPFGLKEIAKKLKTHLLPRKNKSPQIMAILNITPDSFYQKSRFIAQEAIQTIKHYIQIGAKIIDIGGASSKPESPLISPKEELKRLETLLQSIQDENLTQRALFSIDTYNPEVADFALSCGFQIVNDILGFRNPLMIEVCSKYNASVILMHSKGTPETMQTLTNYNNLFEEIDTFFEKKIAQLKDAGIQNIILDIGFGFAKTMEQNLSLIQNLSHFLHFGYPLLVGASRKNTIGLLTNQKVENRLSGTLALHQIALQNGADILRVHDVQEHLDLLKIHCAMEELWNK